MSVKPSVGRSLEHADVIYIAHLLRIHFGQAAPSICDLAYCVVNRLMKGEHHPYFFHMGIEDQPRFADALVDLFFFWLLVAPFLRLFLPRAATPEPASPA